MYEYVITIAATGAVPIGIFAWMMGVAALALIGAGENPRVVFGMPRTLFSRATVMGEEPSIPAVTEGGD